MGNLNINGQAYTLKAEGKLEVKKIKDPKQIEKDFHDDIVVKDGKQGLVSLRADELDVDGSWRHPYVGLPAKGDAIRLELPNQTVEGTVVVSEDENDAMTLTVTKVQQVATRENLEKQIESAKEGLKEAGQKLQQAMEPSPETRQELAQLKQEIKQEIKDVRQAVAPEPTLAERVEHKVEAVRQSLDQDPPPLQKIKNAVNDGSDKVARSVRETVQDLTGQTL
ncbi:MAG: hypothetical protein ACAI44_14230, partial [Candidatus Sericytochromatia bacterium]